MVNRGGGLICVVTFLLLVLLLPSMVFFSRTPFTCLADDGTTDSAGRVIDVYTNKEPFGGKGQNQESDAFEPQEEVVLYALVTYNGDPVSGKMVAFIVQGPLNSDENITFSLSAGTNYAGVANLSFIIPWPDPRPKGTIFGTWIVVASVDIAGIVVSDALSFKAEWIVELLYVRTTDLNNALKNSFAKGERMGFRIGVRNNAMTEQVVTFVVSVSDELNFSIGALRKESQTVSSGESERFLKDLLIPPTAFVGTGRAVANALKTVQGNTSVPRCPSVNTTFLIGPHVMVHDVAVLEVVPSVNEASLGQTVNVTVVVGNLGEVEESFNVSVYANLTLVRTVKVESLAPNAEKTLIFSWLTAEAQLGDYVMKGVAEPVRDEANLENNVLVDGTVKISTLPRPPISDSRLQLAMLFILIVLVVALLVAAVLVFLFCRRRRGKSEESEPKTTAHRVAVLPSAAMKKCKACGREFPAVYTFCPYCLSFHGKDFE